MKEFLERMSRARAAIVEDLTQRHQSGDPNVKLNKRSQGIDDDTSNYVSGAGQLEPCPVCKAGTLRYSRASYNGHVHAACSNEQCVRWME